ALQGKGFDDVTVEMALSPAWTTEWITADGRDKLTRAGIAPPSGLDKLDHWDGLERRRTEPVPVNLQTRRPVACPLCGSVDTRELSRFGSTACKAIHACRTCGETFDEIKAI
ncbi:MAG: phenylacetic acid degradation protein, partial [Marmoricola sp.]|nr:phenylacetic acid degradation protein [Marmoricola sp.]